MREPGPSGRAPSSPPPAAAVACSHSLLHSGRASESGRGSSRGSGRGSTRVMAAGNGSGGSGSGRSRVAAALASSWRLQPLVLLAVLALPGALAYFVELQDISPNGTIYCGFQEIQRYKAWCTQSYIKAWVASNSTCQGYGVCIPLTGAEYMNCNNATFCSARRVDLEDNDYKPEAACLVLQSTQNDTPAVCDVEIDGPSLYDMPPPAPGAAPPPTVEDSSDGGDDWALWKTMTIIWTILGFFAFVVLVFFLVRYCLRRRTEAIRTTPVTMLTDVNGVPVGNNGMQQTGQTAAMQTAGMMGMMPPPDMTVTIRQTMPDGKPVLAYGSSYPYPTPLGTMAYGNGGNQLPANVGDSLLRAAASSREAYNSPPLAAPMQLPPMYGLATTPQTTSATFGGIMTPYGGSPQQPLQPITSPGGLPPMVMPAALTPPTAATLQNPAGSSDVSFPAPLQPLQPLQPLLPLR